jgi:nicotinamidase-related amidase/8-oxo-dGTP pyrophosphatase MutT (NUDIX family)
MNALILVDLQNDFCPGGALAVPEGDHVIAVANQIQPHFDLVVATQDWHPANHGSFAASHPCKRPGDMIDLDGLPQVLWPVHCVQGTPGAGLHPKLDRPLIARVFRKGDDPAIDSYSGFFDNGRRQSTGLGEYLKQRGVTCVYVCGLATDYCVRVTALDAVDLEFQTYLIEDACRGVNVKPGDVQRAIEEMRARGVTVIRSDELPQSNEDKPRVLAEGRFARLMSHRGWEWVERTNTSAAVVIVAITENREIVLVEQYRIPLGRRVIELPAGLVGDLAENKQEDLMEAARRELLEETGYEAEQIEYLLEGPSSAGLANEVYTLLLAKDARKVGPGGGDASEDIRVHVVPLDQAEAWLEAKRREGLMISPKIYSALYFTSRPSASTTQSV